MCPLAKSLDFNLKVLCTLGSGECNADANGVSLQFCLVANSSTAMFPAGPAQAQVTSVAKPLLRLG